MLVFSLCLIRTVLRLTSVMMKIIMCFQELQRFLKNKAPHIVEKADNKVCRKESKCEKLDFSQIPIEEQVVVLFPGQGTQYVGMGKKVS